MTRRLFVALSLPEAVKDRLIDLQSNLEGARWRYADDFHITLAFIGELAAPEANEAATALAAATIGAPFDLSLKGVGSFGDPRPRAVWAKVDASEPLLLLQKKIDVALRRAGFDLEKRKFVPHVTLAYLPRLPMDMVEAWRATYNLYHDGPFIIDRFHLYESHIGRGGAHYDIIASYDL